jgi:hypothetical protein
MPCRDDWPSPTGAQARSQRAAQLLVSLYEKMGKPVTSSLKNDAKDCYCNTDHVKVLCAILKAMSEGERDVYLYDPRDRKARALADWWEDHLESDRQREQAEKKKDQLKKLRLSALKKLTKAEIVALDISEYKIIQWEKEEE